MPSRQGRNRHTRKGGRRLPIDPEERLKVWVRSGGCCTLCGRYLLEGQITGLEMALGELAHNVGQADSPRSPRGQGGMPLEERGKAENLMLVCEDEHEEIDRRKALGLLTVEWLASVKETHEAWIRQLVGLQRSRRTAILRMVGDVRGRSVELSHETAAATVVRSDARYPDFPLSYGHRGIEIDLHGIPGEAEGSATYWRASQQKIDDVIDQKLVEAVRRELVRHVSVFGFARVPLLVYLGTKLDDTYGVTIYQRHRAGETWDWKDSDPIAFTVASRGEPAEEAVAILNVSGTIDETDVPSGLTHLPRYTISPVGVGASEDLVASRSTLESFQATVRSLLSSLEVPAKTVRQLHIIAALPVSAAIALGRAYNRDVHPSLVLYDRTRGHYVPALEIT